MEAIITVLMHFNTKGCYVMEEELSTPVIVILKVFDVVIKHAGGVEAFLVCAKEEVEVEEVAVIHIVVVVLIDATNEVHLQVASSTKEELIMVVVVVVVMVAIASTKEVVHS